ncbi:cytochrome c oxidase subunit IV [Coemansia reversa NRRL 1564]|uniref:Cytochrome c oxidase subunit IV n=1 Tax=Coemansia reversa (strain ATCC 12441 / NRRL 1564) TaxID=763665 RepID=A0A2G5BJ57_COERN|nr:cytochrome c oxidase subunit IV [Coemansia reversa NRRL 1564]|eukprot:PIA19029.1 cytochrome c oxidase subunit IV [Coemansia reversa NRRL 1564]
MFRNAAVGAARLTGRRLQSTTVNPVLTHAEETFGKLQETAQREEVKRLSEIMKADWHKVSIENKRAIFYATYGPHNRRRPRSKPGDNWKVFFGVVGTIAVSVTISTLVRNSVPKPHTMTKEWQEMSNEYAREHNINPISGISSEGYKGKGFVQSS